MSLNCRFVCGVCGFFVSRILRELEKKRSKRIIETIKE